MASIGNAFKVSAAVEVNLVANNPSISYTAPVDGFAIVQVFTTADTGLCGIGACLVGTFGTASTATSGAGFNSAPFGPIYVGPSKTVAVSATGAGVRVCITGVEYRNS